MSMCITCNERPTVCDDNCVECEIEFYLADPGEAEDLIKYYLERPDYFAAWKPVIKALTEGRS